MASRHLHGFVGQFAGQYDIFEKDLGGFFGGIVILAGILKSPLSHFRRSGRPYFWNPFWKFIFCKFSGQVLDLPRWRHNPSWSNRSVNMLKRLSPLLRVPNVQTYQKSFIIIFNRIIPRPKLIWFTRSIHQETLIVRRKGLSAYWVYFG